MSSGPRGSDLRAGNGHCQLYTMAGFMAVRDTKALAPEAEYQAWWDENHSGGRNRVKRVWDGRKLRRAVTMKRNGCDPREIAEAVGIKNAGTIGTMLSSLPPELRP